MRSLYPRCDRSLYSGNVDSLILRMVHAELKFIGGRYRVYARSRATGNLFLVGKYRQWHDAANAVYHLQEIAKHSED